MHPGYLSEWHCTYVISYFIYIHTTNLLHNRSHCEPALVQGLTARATPNSQLLLANLWISS